jgi:hypothetical protein
LQLPCTSCLTPAGGACWPSSPGCAARNSSGCTRKSHTIHRNEDPISGCQIGVQTVLFYLPTVSYWIQLALTGDFSRRAWNDAEALPVPLRGGVALSVGARGTPRSRCIYPQLRKASEFQDEGSQVQVLEGLQKRVSSVVCRREVCDCTLGSHLQQRPVVCL